MTHFENIKIDKNNIIEHNKHILAVSGGDFGIISNSNLDFAIDSVNNRTDPISQATDFLYYTTTGHPFVNGNKRTAFEVAQGIMLSGSRVLTAPQEEIISFVTGSLAQGKTTKEEVNNWLSSNSEITGKHPDFNEIVTENIEKDKGPSPVLTGHIGKLPQRPQANG